MLDLARPVMDAVNLLGADSIIAQSAICGYVTCVLTI
jgi:hypothetical protein